MELSVVIPCLNEAASIGACVETARASIERMGLEGEVVVADNGSTDGANGRNFSRCLMRALRMSFMSSRRGSAMMLRLPSARGPHSIRP